MNADPGRQTRNLLSGDAPADHDAMPPARPITASVLARDLLERDIRRALHGLNLKLDLVSTSGLLIARIESACPELLILELDISPVPADLARFARSLRPDVRIVAAHWYWSDRDTATFADAVVHKPARRDEWFPAMVRIALSFES